MMAWRGGLLVALIGLISCSSSAHDFQKSRYVGRNISDICSELKNQPITYLLLNQAGKVAGAMRNTEITADAVALAADTVDVDTGFRLLVSRPGSFSFSSPDLTLRKTKATCAGSTEHSIAYRSSPKVASALVNGERGDIPVLIDGPGESDRWEGVVAVDLKVLSPLVKVDEGARETLGEFIKGASSTSSVEIRNAGSSALRISGVVFEQKSGRWYRIDAANCVGNLIPSSGSCAISLTRLGGPMPDAEQTDVIKLNSNDKLGYPTIFIKWSGRSPEIFFRRD